jgi:hypothetical protein
VILLQPTPFPGSTVDNPYQPPRTIDETTTPARWKQRIWNVWVFAMIWPFVAILIHRLTLPLLPMLGRDWLSLWTVIILSPFLLGYAVCIISAVRYPASAKTRVLRGIGSILLFVASGLVARLVFALIYLALR